MEDYHETHPSQGDYILGFLAPYAFWMVFVGLVLLVLGLLLKGL